jgi:hypothetical protein
VNRRGDFLRQNGIYGHQLNQWKLEMTKGLDVGFKNLEELKGLVKKIKEQDAIIELQKKTSQYFMGRGVNRQSAPSGQSFKSCDI